MTRRTTTSQTVGPFYSLGLLWLCSDTFAADGVPGERITITGRVLDGAGCPVPDALLEIWQANAVGRYAHDEDTQEKPLEADFSGFGRIPTDDEGSFRFTTIKPGRVPGLEGSLQAPHLEVSVFCRGLLRRLVTRIYFGDEPSNVEDFALSLVPESRRNTLIATPCATGNTYEWNVVLQGAGETVFFDIGL